MRILFEKKQKQVLENADYIFEAIDTRNEEMRLEAVMKAVEITHIQDHRKSDSGKGKAYIVDREHLENYIKTPSFIDPYYREGGDE